VLKYVRGHNAIIEIIRSAGPVPIKIDKSDPSLDKVTFH